MKYVALLRGIAPMNPNMQNEKLRGVFEQLGFTDVKSVISSGNIVFTSPRTDVTAIEAEIEQAWPQKLGFTSTTVVRSLDDLKELVAANPFKGLTHSRELSLNVTFLKRPAADGVQLPGIAGCTVHAVRPREMCVAIDLSSVKTPDYMVKAERTFGKEITTRTWKTVERIIKALES